MKKMLKTELERARDRIAVLEDALELSQMNLGTERSLVRSLRMQFEELLASANACDQLYQTAVAEVAAVRVALEAPNPCILVEWATAVKKKAGRMESDIVSQAAKLNA